MFTLPERMILADEEWLPVLQGKWVSKPDYTLMVTDNVMQGQFGRFMPYGPVKFHVGYYDYNSTDIILIPEHAKEFDNYCGFAFPRICNGEIYLRMLMHDAVMGFYFIRPGQKPSDKRVSSMFSQTVMGPAAMKQPASFAMMGKPLDPPPKFCRHCGSIPRLLILCRDYGKQEQERGLQQAGGKSRKLQRIHREGCCL